LTKEFLHFKRESESIDMALEDYFDMKNFQEIKLRDNPTLSELCVSVNTLLLLRG